MLVEATLLLDFLGLGLCLMETRGSVRRRTYPRGCGPALTAGVWTFPVTVESMILPAWFTAIPARSGSAMAEEILLAGS